MSIVPGSASSPSINIQGSTTTGIYSPNTNQLAISANTYEVVQFSSVASSVNYWSMAASATTNALNLIAAGTDTNIGINITPKGTGTVTLGYLDNTVIGSNTSAAGTFTIASIGNGTVSAPGLALTSDATTGLYRPSATNLSITTGGINTAQFSSSNMTAGTHYTVSSATPQYIAGTSTGYLQLSLQNKSNGTVASTDVVCTADTGTDTTNYVNFGINSSGFSGTGFSNALDGYLYSQSTNLAIGTVAAKDLIVLANNTVTSASAFA